VRSSAQHEFEFEGTVIEWRGPAPFYFVAIPHEESDDIKFVAKGIEYWGQVPVTARISGTEFSTALFPKDGRYLLPLKKAVRESAGIALDQASGLDQHAEIFRLGQLASSLFTRDDEARLLAHAARCLSAKPHDQPLDFIALQRPVSWQGWMGTALQPLSCGSRATMPTSGASAAFGCEAEMDHNTSSTIARRVLAASRPSVLI